MPGDISDMVELDSDEIDYKDCYRAIPFCIKDLCDTPDIVCDSCYRYEDCFK